MLFSVFSKQYRREPEIVFSEFMAAVERGDVREVVIQGHNIEGKYKSGESFRTFVPDDPELVKSLRVKQVKIAAKPDDESPWYMLLLLNWLPMLLLIGVWIFFMRQMQVGGGKAMSFGKSRAKLLTENQHRVTFSDVAGVDEAKDDLQEIIAFLKDPKKFIETWRPNSQRVFARGGAGNRQDPVGSGHRRRSRCPVLQYQWFRFRRNVCRCRSFSSS